MRSMQQKGWLCADYRLTSFMRRKPFSFGAVSRGRQVRVTQSKDPADESRTGSSSKAKKKEVGFKTKLFKRSREEKIHAKRGIFSTNQSMMARSLARPLPRHAQGMANQAARKRHFKVYTSVGTMTALGKTMGPLSEMERKHMLCAAYNHGAITVLDLNMVTWGRFGFIASAMMQHW